MPVAITVMFKRTIKSSDHGVNWDVNNVDSSQNIIDYNINWPIHSTVDLIYYNNAVG